MLDPKLLRESPEVVRAAIARKHLDIDLDPVLTLDAQWRAQLGEVEALRSRQKSANNEMAALRKGSPEFIAKVQEMRGLSGQVKEKEAGLAQTETRWRAAMLTLPNIPHPSVPEGRTAGQNVVCATHGATDAVSAHARPHWEITGFDRLFDFARGAKVTGAGFPFYVGDGARLVRALIQFFLDEAGRAGYQEVHPPVRRQRGQRHRGGAASGQGRNDVPDGGGSVLPSAHRRDTAHQLLS